MAEVRTTKPSAAEIQEEIKPWLEIRPWKAGDPFPLIPTPAKVTGINREDPTNEGATHMALVHNVIVRALNSIYLQARQVAPTKISAVTSENKADVQLRDDFVAYAKQWTDFVHLHHHHEEAYLFPTIEKLVAVPGLMEGNVSQHKDFGEGMDRLSAYITQVSRPEGNQKDRVGEDKFLYGPTLCEIIESFGEVLVRHLTEEIATLMALKEYAGVLDIRALMDGLAEHALKSASLTGSLVFFMSNLDLDFEGGIHADFPPAPGLIKFLVRNFLWVPKRRLWRFSTSYSTAKLRPKLAYGPESISA